MLKLLIEGNLVKGKKKIDMYYMVSDYIVEYVRQGMINEARYLVKFDCENDVTDLTKLYAAALSTNEPLPDRILRVSVSKTSWTHRLLSPLHCACINPNLQVLKTLLRICPTFSLPDKNRRNLIHYAAVNPNDEVIKFLLANGCDANELDSGRKTPLMIAAQRGLIGNVVALI
jgi:ankyrin repeat protein